MLANASPGMGTCVRIILIFIRNPHTIYIALAKNIKMNFVRHFHIFSNFFATNVICIFSIRWFFSSFFLRHFSFHYFLLAILSFDCFDKIHYCHSFEGVHFPAVVSSVVFFGSKNSQKLSQHFSLSKNIVTRTVFHESGKHARFGKHKDCVITVIFRKPCCFNQCLLQGSLALNNFRQSNRFRR